MDLADIPKKGTLETRINKFANKYPKQTAEELHALRLVGNTGSHQGDLKWDAMLDTFVVYERWLINFYAKEKENIDALVEKLINTKGKY